MTMEWIVSSCVLILAVLALRAALGKRISARLRYALWLAVLVRLLVPVQLFTSTVVGISVPELPAVSAQTLMGSSDSSTGTSQNPHVAAPDTYLAPGTAFVPDVGNTAGESAASQPTGVELRLEEVLPVVWVLGTAACAAVFLASNVQFYVNLRKKRKRIDADCPLPVYAAEGLPSPCLFGLMRPAVYVTREAAENPVMLRHVLVHEATHARHLDHVWSFLRAAALAIHWWNPLVWLAVALSRRDGELACDEGALQALGDGERRAYGETLLALVTAGNSPRELVSCATTMGGSKRSLRERFQRIAHRPRQLLGAAVAAVAVLSLVALCAFGRQVEPTEEDGDGRDEQTNAPLMMSAGGDWQDAQIMVDENGYPHIRYADDQEWVPLGGPIAPPVEWQDPDDEEALAGRSECTALPGGDEEIWAGLVSPTNGWLVACYGHGMASADIYVYKTADGGQTWTEVTKPCNTVTEKDVHTWHVSTAGFVSPDTLIVTCRLFDAAPCFITRDGGETWEQIPLPGEYMHVESIEVHGQLVTMNIARYEGGAAQYIMNSRDMGETWDISALPALPLTPDLNRDRTPEVVRAFFDGKEEKQILTVEQDDQVLWTGEAYTSHAGWNAYFLCRMDGKDCLLQFNPYMGGGVSQYQYRLFHLDSSGGEVVEQENSVEFDFLFAEDFSDTHRFEPAEIAAFVDEINGLLENGMELVNTDGNLQSAFEWTGKQRYTLAPFCDGDGYTWDDTQSELENLLAYQESAQHR